MCLSLISDIVQPANEVRVQSSISAEFVGVEGLAGLSPIIYSRAISRAVQKHLAQGVWACGAASYGSNETWANAELCLALRLENVDVVAWN